MMRPMLKKTAFVLVAAAALFRADSALARNDCYAWGQARPIISGEGLMPLRDASASVTNRYGGKLIGAKLCERKGRFVYDITVLRDGGQVTSVTVNGRTGAHIRAVGGVSAAAAAGGGMPKLKKPKFKWKFWKKKKN